MLRFESLQFLDAEKLVSALWRPGALCGVRRRHFNADEDPAKAVPPADARELAGLNAKLPTFSHLRPLR